jgi:hypothetical protein
LYAGDESGNNNVTLINTRSYSWMPKASTAVTENPGPTVENQNSALAHASCTYCRTVAVAVQVLVVEGPTNDFRPFNAAVAENENCSFCQTFAYANQIVLSPQRPVYIDRDTRKQANEIRKRIAEVTRSWHDFATMGSELDALTQELAAVIQGAIDRSGTYAGREQHRDVREDND